MDNKRIHTLIFELTYKNTPLSQEDFAEIKPFINEGETVLKALQRLGNSTIDLSKYIDFDYDGKTGERTPK